MSNSIERVHLTVDGVTHALGPLEHVDDLRDQILRAARDAGGFLNVTLDGGQRLSFFVTSTTSIVISVTTAPFGSDTPGGDYEPWDADIPDHYNDGDTPYDIV